MSSRNISDFWLWTLTDVISRRDIISRGCVSTRLRVVDANRTKNGKNSE